MRKAVVTLPILLRTTQGCGHIHKYHTQNPLRVIDGDGISVRGISAVGGEGKMKTLGHRDPEDSS